MTVKEALQMNLASCKEGKKMKLNIKPAPEEYSKWPYNLMYQVYGENAPLSEADFFKFMGTWLNKRQLIITQEWFEGADVTELMTKYGYTKDGIFNIINSAIDKLQTLTSYKQSTPLSELLKLREVGPRKLQALVCALYDKGYSIENDVKLNNSSLEDKRKEYERLKARVKEMKEMYGFED